MEWRKKLRGSEKQFLTTDEQRLLSENNIIGRLVMFVPLRLQQEVKLAIINSRGCWKIKR